MFLGLKISNFYKYLILNKQLNGRVWVVNPVLYTCGIWLLPPSILIINLALVCKFHSRAIITYLLHTYYYSGSLLSTCTHFNLWTNFKQKRSANSSFLRWSVGYFFFWHPVSPSWCVDKLTDIFCLKLVQKFTP